jgi:hypothetical protein
MMLIVKVRLYTGFFDADSAYFANQDMMSFIVFDCLVDEWTGKAHDVEEFEQ